MKKNKEWFYGLIKSEPTEKDETRSNVASEMRSQYGTVIKMFPSYDDRYYSLNVIKTVSAPHHQDGNWDWHECMFEWIMPEREYLLKKLEIL